MSVHQGKCRDCGWPMVTQREWRRNQRIRPGRKKYGGFGMCQACYVRARRQGRLPLVTVTPSYPVRCERCGPVAEVGRHEEAQRIRAAHLEEHGFGHASSSKLSDAELARLRRMVGVT